MRRATLLMAAVLGAGLAAGAAAYASYEEPKLLPKAKLVFESHVAGGRFVMKCTYAARDRLGYAEPAYNGLPPRVWVKPSTCRLVNALVRTPKRAAQTPYYYAEAVFILTHEATHVSDYEGALDEGKTHCRALQLVGAVSRRLGAPPKLADELSRQALVVYEAHRDRLPAAYYDPECRNGGALDLRPGSDAWPG